MSTTPKPYHEWEMKHNLLNGVNVNGFQYWNYMRRDMFMSFNDELAGTEPPFYKNMEKKGLELGFDKVKDVIWQLLHTLKTDKKDVDALFICHPRRQLLDGKMVSIYTDYIADHFPNSVTLERVGKQRLKKDEVYSKNVVYNYRLEVMSYIYRYFVKTFRPGLYAKVRAKIENDMREPFNDLKDNYGFNPKFKSFCERATALYFFYKFRYPRYRKFIENLNPKVIVEVVSGSVNTKIINEIAHDLKIPTIELQHGTGALLNWFPEGTRTRQFTDWYFAFASFWKDATGIPLDDEHICSLGFPYHDMMMKAYPRESWQHDKNTVIFLSSRKYGAQMSELAVKMKELNNDLHIIYKLHPREIEGWREKYKALASSDIEVIDEVKTPLYSLFARSSMQVGVESTAVYEGMSFELETFIWDIPQSAPMKILCDKGFAKSFRTAEDFVEMISNETGHVNYDASEFWAEDSMTKIVEKIKEIIK